MIGVCDVVVARVVNGRRHRSSPVSRETPTKFSCVNTTTCRTPPKSATSGEP